MSLRLQRQDTIVEAESTPRVANTFISDVPVPRVRNESLLFINHQFVAFLLRQHKETTTNQAARFSHLWILGPKARLALFKIKSM